ncbi:MAG: prolipoprotein diacylglyceryl transferase [Sphaerochaetaceae bacterium]
MPLYVDFPSWISPVLIPGLPLRWYSFMYLVAFAITFLLFRYQQKKTSLAYSGDDLYSLFLYAIVGLLLGARLGSTLLYEGSSYYWRHPHLIFWPFRNGQFIGLPGMSYHGGLVGVVVGVALFCRSYKKDFFETADALTAAIPLGYTFGRLGNFINGELWGRVSTVKWAMVFPDAPRFSTNYAWVRSIADALGIEYGSAALLNLPRHPSQLYEALFEGVVLWLFLWFFIRKRKRYSGQTTAWYLIGYAVVRFFIEYVREPDPQLGFAIAWGRQKEPTALFLSLLNISMGQLLCILMLVAGVVLLLFRKRKQHR